MVGWRRSGARRMDPGGEGEGLRGPLADTGTPPVTRGGRAAWRAKVRGRRVFLFWRRQPGWHRRELFQSLCPRTNSSGGRGLFSFPQRRATPAGPMGRRRSPACRTAAAQAPAPWRGPLPKGARPCKRTSLTACTSPKTSSPGSGSTCAAPCPPSPTPCSTPARWSPSGKKSCTPSSARNWPGRRWTAPPPISPSPKRSGRCTRCTAPRPCAGPTAWSGPWAPRPTSTISSRATTPAAPTS